MALLAMGTPPVQLAGQTIAAPKTPAPAQPTTSGASKATATAVALAAPQAHPTALPQAAPAAATPGPQVDPETPEPAQPIRVGPGQVPPVAAPAPPVDPAALQPVEPGQPKQPIRVGPGEAPAPPVKAPATPANSATPQPAPVQVASPTSTPVAHGAQVDTAPAATTAAAVTGDQRHQPTPSATPATTQPAADKAPTAAQAQHGRQTAGDDQASSQQGQPDRHESAPPRPEHVTDGVVRIDPTTNPAETAPVAPTRQAISVAAPAAPVRLRELPEAVGTAMRVAVRDGSTTARIELNPEHLGKVEIQLRYETGGGVHAQVLADSHAAVTVLASQAQDLRRSLETQGFTVLGLDIQQSGVGAGSTPDRGPGFSGGGHQYGGPQSEDETTNDTTIVDVTSLPLASGQVDVLA